MLDCIQNEVSVEIHLLCENLQTDNIIQTEQKSNISSSSSLGFLDPEKKLFSHRILSRDECIDPFSKTGNLR